MSRKKELESYPEALQGDYLGLENHLLSLAHGGSLYRHSALPAGFTSGALEHYVNWFGSQTAADPKQLERGSVVFFDHRLDDLVFPRVAWQGKHQVLIHLPLSESCLPLSVSHSHPTNSCFSTYGDLSHFLTKKDLLMHRPYIPLMQVANPNLNFFMLRAAETISLGLDTDDLWLAASLSAMRNDFEIEEVFELFSYKNQYGTALPREEFERLHWLSGINLERPTSTDLFFNSFFISHLEIFYASKKLQFGLYVSMKDGKYHRLGKHNLIDILTIEVWKRFEIARKLAHQRSSF